MSVQFLPFDIVFFYVWVGGCHSTHESPSLPRPFEATFVVTWRSWHWKVATAAGTEPVELHHGENRLWDPGSVTKKSPLLKSHRILFKEDGESLQSIIFQGQSLLNFRDVFLLMDVVVVIVCMFSRKQVFIPVKICFFIH